MKQDINNLRAQDIIDLVNNEKDLKTQFDFGDWKEWILFEV